MLKQVACQRPSRAVFGVIQKIPEKFSLADYTFYSSIMQK
jgi:hypothetical protein